jgi:hypothetical protein
MNKRGLIAFLLIGGAIGGYIFYLKYKREKFKKDCIDKGGKLVNDFTCDVTE